MSGVEEADVTKVDRLLEQHRWRNHAPVDEVPCSPHVVPLLDSRQTKRRARFGWGGEKREHEQRTLKQPERVPRSTVGPAMNRT